MALTGLRAGLVGITAGADSIAPWAAVIVGAVAGVLVVFSVIILDKFQLDDPVGAISVHGTCGIWGTLAVGIWGGANFMVQLIGTLSISAFAFFASLIVFGLLKFTVGLRVSEQEEEEGLDVGEHGVASYPNFQPAVDY
jgi:Amt family ammonium transporter